MCGDSDILKHNHMSLSPILKVKYNLYLPVLQTSCRVLGLENLYSSQEIQL